MAADAITSKEDRRRDTPGPEEDQEAAVGGGGGLVAVAERDDDVAAAAVNVAAAATDQCIDGLLEYHTHVLLYSVQFNHDAGMDFLFGYRLEERERDKLSTCQLKRLMNRLDDDDGNALGGGVPHAQGDGKSHPKERRSSFFFHLVAKIDFCGYLTHSFALSAKSRFPQTDDKDALVWQTRESRGDGYSVVRPLGSRARRQVPCV